MDYLEIVRELINTLGFPIVCCYFLFTYIKDKDKDMQDLSNQYDMNIDALTEALNNNTRAMDRLVMVLDKEKEVSKDAENE